MVCFDYKAIAMDYSIDLYRKEVKDKFQLFGNKDFLKDKNNLFPFTENQKEWIEQRLDNLGYEFVALIVDCAEYNHADSEIVVLMTDCGLYVSASNIDLSMEILGMSFEFMNNGELAGYDPQRGEWI